VLSTLPEFSLLDQHGATVTSGALAGRPFVADFIFTRCPAACPRLTARMKELAGRLPDDSPARLVSISVDPVFDRPEVLAAYAASREISAPRWLLLTGEREAIWDLVRKGFLLPIEEQNDPANPILHSNRFALVDAEGRLRGTYEAFEAGALELLLDDLRALEREARRR
jgi:cytochrome oxidase Cu insertion factor (SCO1/SenC/PrrC family)